MEIISDAILAFLASAGILFILWTLMGVLFPPECIGKGRALLVLQAAGGISSIEWAKRAVDCVSNVVRRPVRVVVTGVNPQGDTLREAEYFCFYRGIEIVSEELPLSALLQWETPSDDLEQN